MSWLCVFLQAVMFGSVLISAAVANSRRQEVTFERLRHPNAGWVRLHAYKSVFLIHRPACSKQTHLLRATGACWCNFRVLKHLKPLHNCLIGRRRLVEVLVRDAIAAAAHTSLGWLRTMICVLATVGCHSPAAAAVDAPASTAPANGWCAPACWYPASHGDACQGLVMLLLHAIMEDQAKLPRADRYQQNASRVPAVAMACC